MKTWTSQIKAQIFLVAILTQCGCANDAPKGDGADWLDRPPENTFKQESSIAVTEKNVYEIVYSKKNVAEYVELKDSKFEKIDIETAKDYTGHYYECPPNKTPYLFRAVYGHGGTGRFSVSQEGRKVLIMHQSLGKTNYVLNLY